MIAAALRGSAIILVLHAASALPSLIARLVRGRGGTDIDGIHNYSKVTETLWRGAAPTHQGYEYLAAQGVEVIVDLRAEADLAAVLAMTDPLGLELVHIPIRDGQTLTGEQVTQIAATLSTSDTLVFVHCGAGVGRTGTVVASRLVAAGMSSGRALAEALSFGPLTVEQQVFIATSTGSHTGFATAAVVVLSRIIDSPRRLVARLTT
jgi:protein-tyrosine phosphatase